MRRIAHLSDLHFGAHDPRALEPLLATLRELEPDLIAISGDLTQRARRSQYRAARDFLDRLPARPRIVVPGNHDIPFWDVIRRFTAPLDRFNRYITPEPHPVHVDPEIAVVGVNTARSLALSNGRISQRQLDALRSRLAQAPARAVRIVVAHHPFVLPEGMPKQARVGRATLALPIFADMGVHVLLTGHRHVSWTAHIEGSSGRSTLVIHAGTTTSLRTRGEDNMFNEVIVDGASVDVVHYSWRAPASRFEAVASERQLVRLRA